MSSIIFLYSAVFWRSVDGVDTQDNKIINPAGFDLCKKVKIKRLSTFVDFRDYNNYCTLENERGPEKKGRETLHCTNEYLPIV